MNTKAELKKFSEFVATIKSITRVYEQAAARKMAMVRIEIEKIRDYLAAAEGTYASTKLSVASEEDEKMRGAILSTAFRAPEKDRILVLIASQHNYFGNLIPSLFKLFLEEYRTLGGDALILGMIGRELMNRSGMISGDITYFDFDDASPNWEVVHKVSQYLAAYEQIVIFYGQYRSVLTQEAKRVDLAQTVVVSEAPEIKQYWFAGESLSPLSFLENQMIAGDFLQKIYESQLAKYGARIKILEIGQVAEKISEALDSLGRFRRKVRKNVSNKKQMQLFCGSQLWQKETITEL